MADVVDLCDSDDETTIPSTKHTTASTHNRKYDNSNNNDDVIEIDDSDDVIASTAPSTSTTTTTSTDRKRSLTTAPTTTTDTIKRAKPNASSNTTQTSTSTPASTKAKFSKSAGTVNTRLQKELIDVTKNPPPGVIANCIDDSNMFKWNAVINGPPESPYAGGEFAIDIDFPKEYPFKPPHLKFKTQIYHCNISAHGDICLDILKDQWSPALTITKVLLSLISLLTDPNPDSPLNGPAGTQLKRNRKQYEAECTKQTKKYAMPVSPGKRRRK